MFLSELTKIINAGPPQDVNPASLNCAYVNMKNYTHLTAILQMGAGAPPVIKVEKSANGVGAGTPITFKWRKCNVAYGAAGGDTLAALAAATGGAAGEAMGATDNSFAVIELEASELLPEFPWVRVVVTTGGAGLFSCIYVLSGARYQEPTEEAIKV
jgi:hypothetical protein